MGFKKRRPYWSDYGSKAERVFAQDLGERGIRVKAQPLIEIKNSHKFIKVRPDFMLLDYGICIEIDGPSHSKTKAKDKWRDEQLVKQGKCKKVVRFTNMEVYDSLAIEALEAMLESK